MLRYPSRVVSAYSLALSPLIRMSSPRLCQAVTLVALVVAAGCDAVFTPPFTYAAVEVTVTLPDGVGVPDVPLVLYSGTRHLAYADTDSSGAAYFDFVAEGPTGVGASSTLFFRAAEHPDGYYRTFSVSEGDLVQVAFNFEDARGSIRLQVLDQMSQPVSGLDVELYTSLGVQIRQTLPASGSLLFSKLSPADYGVRVLGSGTCPLLPAGFVYRDRLGVGVQQDLSVEIVLPPCAV